MGLANPDNPQSAEGDLILPMPHGASMTFRPVFIGGEGNNPFSLQLFVMGDPDEGFRENLTGGGIGGAFRGDNLGRQDWLYYLGKYEVSEAQYYAMMAPNDASKRTSHYPIRNISWLEAQEFIHQYNLWLFEHARDVLPRHDNAIGFLRLPTEVEWEFAARGGVAVPDDVRKARHPYGGPLSKFEWFAGPSSSHNKVQPIGVLHPNPLHLHDMLGNVAEMMSSLYQVEYYQGRVGGFVARGGHYLTQEHRLRASIRTEQPFYGANLQPQRSPTLGLRLAISAVIFSDLDTASWQKAWEGHRQSPSSKESPAALSIAPLSTQIGVKLEKATELVREMLHDKALAPARKRQLEILQASFGKIQEDIKRADVIEAYAWVEIATNRALYISRALQEKSSVQKNLERIEHAGVSTAVIEKHKQALADLLKEIETSLQAYSKSLDQLDRREDDSIKKATNEYLAQLKGNSDVDRIRILHKAVTKHFAQYTKSKRPDFKQWEADLEKL
jgi:hypothetical protein